MIGGFIVIIIGTTLIPSIADSITDIRTVNGSNVTGAAGTVLGLVTLFFALGIMAAGVSLAVGGLKNAGIL